MRSVGVVPAFSGFPLVIPVPMCPHAPSGLHSLPECHLNEGEERRGGERREEERGREKGVSVWEREKVSVKQCSLQMAVFDSLSLSSLFCRLLISS